MKKNLSFEDAIKRLEEIVALLSDGELPLEQSLLLFKEGAGLVELCNSRLADAKLKLETLFPDAHKPEEPDDE